MCTKETPKRRINAGCADGADAPYTKHKVEPVAEPNPDRSVRKAQSRAGDTGENIYAICTIIGTIECTIEYI